MVVHFIEYKKGGFSNKNIACISQPLGKVRVPPAEHCHFTLGNQTNHTNGTTDSKLKLA